MTPINFFESFVVNPSPKLAQHHETPGSYMATQLVTFPPGSRREHPPSNGRSCPHFSSSFHGRLVMSFDHLFGAMFWDEKNHMGHVTGLKFPKKDRPQRVTAGQDSFPATGCRYKSASDRGGTGSHEGYHHWKVMEEVGLIHVGPFPLKYPSGMHFISSFRVQGVRGLQGSYEGLCGNIIFLDGNTVTHSPTISPSISATIWRFP